MDIPLLSTLVFIIKFLGLVIILSVVSAVFSRLRIDQLADIGWRILVPLALLQLLVVIFMGF
jgi:NADH:ubiquinone oxidoreductase subunit H